MSKKWYAIHTKPRQEKRAEENLQRQEFTVYLPRLQVAKRRKDQWVDVIEPMFPRYLFIELMLSEDNIAPIRSTMGVSKLVRFGDEPAVVPTTFIETLMKSQDQLKGCHVSTEELFEQGTTVEVVKGPLSGIQGIVKCDKGDDRVILLLNILGRENELSVSRNSLTPS